MQTLHTKVGYAKNIQVEEPLLPTSSPTTQGSPRKPPVMNVQHSPLRRFIQPDFLAIFINQSLTIFVSNCILAITPLFCFTPLFSGDYLCLLYLCSKLILSKGGLGFTQGQIGTVLGFRGFAAVAIQLAIFPRLHSYLGTIGTIRTLIICYPILCGVFPLTEYSARHETLDGHRPLAWGGAFLIVGIWSWANMIFASNSILITNSVPSRGDLGTAHGWVNDYNSLCERPSNLPHSEFSKCASQR